MQEEIEHKTVNFAISTVKLSARTLLKGAQFFLRQYDKSASQGKQSMNRLIRQNRGVTNLEIEKTGIKDFDRYAKRYHIDYAIQKDLSCTPPRYLIFFKAQDTDALNAAFKEYLQLHCVGQHPEIPGFFIVRAGCATVERSDLLRASAFRH